MDADTIFDNYVDQGWDDSSKLLLLNRFLAQEARKDKALWDRLDSFLGEAADEENGDSVAGVTAEEDGE